MSVSPNMVCCLLFGMSVFQRRSVGRWGWMLNVKPAAKILFSGILPPYGISILVMMPFEYLESRKTIRIMKRSYDVGGEVGIMINSGRTEDEIRVYLSSRIIAKNRVRRWSGKNPSGGRENAVTHTPSAYENESADCRSDQKTWLILKGKIKEGQTYIVITL